MVIGWSGFALSAAYRAERSSLPLRPQSFSERLFFSRSLIVQSRLVIQKREEASVSASDTEFLSDAARKQPKACPEAAYGDVEYNNRGQRFLTLFNSTSAKVYCVIFYF